MRTLRMTGGFVALAVIAATGACKKNEEAQTPAAAAPPAAAPPAATPPAAAPATASPGGDARKALLDPSQTETAPASYKIKFATTKGDFVVEVHRDWAPNGADRLYHLVKIGYFDDCEFFRVIKGFMVQFGIHGDPAANTAWHNANIPDDPKKESNKRGRLTFATAGPNTRTTQLFINYADNTRLDDMGFTPVGEVTSGMEIVDALEGQYGEGQPGGRGPAQDRIQGEGNAYLKAEYPKLDGIKSAKLQ